jgi:hypothetical protein
MRLADFVDPKLAAIDAEAALSEAAVLVRGAGCVVLTEATREDCERLAHAGDLLAARAIGLATAPPHKQRDRLDGGKATLSELADLIAGPNG